MDTGHVKEGTQGKVMLSLEREQEPWEEWDRDAFCDSSTGTHVEGEKDWEFRSLTAGQ